MGNGAARVFSGSRSRTIAPGAPDFFDARRRPDATDFPHLRLPKLTWEQNFLGTTTGPPWQTRRSFLEENAKNYLFLLLRRLLASSSRQDEEDKGGSIVLNRTTGAAEVAENDGTFGTISNKDGTNYDVLSFVRSAVRQHLLDRGSCADQGWRTADRTISGVQPASPFLSSQEKEELGLSEDAIMEELGGSGAGAGDSKDVVPSWLSPAPAAAPPVPPAVRLPSVPPRAVRPRAMQNPRTDGAYHHWCGTIGGSSVDSNDHFLAPVLSQTAGRPGRVPVLSPGNKPAKASTGSRPQVLSPHRPAPPAARSPVPGSWRSVATPSVRGATDNPPRTDGAVVPPLGPNEPDLPGMSTPADDLTSSDHDDNYPETPPPPKSPGDRSRRTNTSVPAMCDLPSSNADDLMRIAPFLILSSKDGGPRFWSSTLHNPSPSLFFSSAKRTNYQRTKWSVAGSSGLGRWYQRTKAVVEVPHVEASWCRGSDGWSGQYGTGHDGYDSHSWQGYEKGFGV